MRLELEKLVFERDSGGDWSATFTVRNEENAPLLTFNRHCRGSKEGNHFGSRQSVPADQAIGILMESARAHMREIADGVASGSPNAAS